MTHDAFLKSHTTSTISKAQQRNLHDNGYVHLPNTLSTESLAQLRTLASDLEKNALEISQKQETSNLICMSNQATVLRCRDIYLHSPKLILKLLASPELQHIASQLCAPDAVPLSADLLFKQPLPELPISWHQDAPSTTANSHIIIGIYLDDASPHDGCLRYVKGSHHERQDISQLAKQYGWNIPNSEECPAKAGDIIVHTAMALHGSAPKYSPGSRRTIYIEMQSAQELNLGKHYPKPWIELRSKWMNKALAWESQPIDELQQFMQQLSDNWAPFIPANYGQEQVKTENYPTPKKSI